MRYLLHESDHPISTDYYYECRKTTNDHFPIIPAHTHDYYEIYIYLSGSVMLFIEGRIYKVKRGDIMVIPPYTIHQLLLTSELAKENKRYHFNIADSDDFERIFQCFMGIYQNSKREFREKEMLNRAHILEAVTLLNKHILLDMKPRKATHVNPLIDKVLSYINEHYKEDLSLEQLAGHFYLNKFTLAKLFKEQTDRTVHNYIILKRISMAKQKITEGMLPSVVYQDVGFRDYSTFYRAFLKMEKISPKEFARFCSDKKDN